MPKWSARRHTTRPGYRPSVAYHFGFDRRRSPFARLRSETLGSRTCRAGDAADGRVTCGGVAPRRPFLKTERRVPRQIESVAIERSGRAVLYVVCGTCVGKIGDGRLLARLLRWRRSHWLIHTERLRLGRRGGSRPLWRCCRCLEFRRFVGLTFWCAWRSWIGTLVSFVPAGGRRLAAGRSVVAGRARRSDCSATRFGRV
jgi:hypothetical protein